MLPKYLGLNSKEEKIINTLQLLAELSLDHLSEKTKIPRTTLYTHLRNLKRRELIFTTKKKKFLLIRLNERYFSNNIFVDSVKPEKDIIPFEGAGFLSKYIHYSSCESVTERVRWIQPSYVTKKVFELIDQNDFVHTSKKIMKNHLIVESILSKDFFDVFHKYTTLHENGEQILQHYLNRPYETYVTSFPENGKIEIIIYQDFVVYSDWETLSGFVTYNKNMINFFKMYFESLKLQSSKVDAASEIRKVFQ